MWTNLLENLLSYLAVHFGYSEAVSIIVLTLIARVALMPVSLTSAYRMQRNKEAIERIKPALEELRRAAAANISSGTATPLPLQVPGATPQAASLRVRLGGRLPDGRPVQMQVALFALGTRVFQATALGERLEPEASETFFGSIRLQP